MKKYITIVLMIVSVFTSFAQKSMDQFYIQVDGLGCPFCAYGLEKKFKEFKQIKKVSIQIETGDFSFAYSADSKLTMDKVIAQVKRAGYTPKTAKIERNNGEVEIFPVAKTNDIKTQEVKKELLRVKGNCAMCKSRIETAALELEGVQNAEWNVETKFLQVSFNETKTSLSAIAKQIAKVGHDNEKYKAEKQVYESLPPCCSYKKQ